MKTAQSGIQKRGLFHESLQAQGLLLRGVVVVTYVLDDPNHPAASPPQTDPEATNPVAVYCDVLIYSPKRGLHSSILKLVPVMQDRGGLHDGRIWKPKATTIDVTENTLHVESGSIPGNFDGDHVLVGFLDDSLSMPVILGGIPHPSHDIGNMELDKGHRRGLKLADGHPDFWKHHGTFYGVDDNGDYLVDTTFANDGQLNPNGTEADPPTDGKGAQKRKLPMDAEHRTEWFDMSTLTAPVSKAFQSLKKALRQVSLEDGKATEKMDLTSFERSLDSGKSTEKMDSSSYEVSVDQTKAILKVVAAMMELKLLGPTLKAEGMAATAKLTVGDGAMSALIAEAWQIFWDGPFTAWATAHIHPTGVGPSGPPDPSTPGPFPVYATSAATSTHVKFPAL